MSNTNETGSSTSGTPTHDAYAGPPPESRLAIGTLVSKQGGDYRFDGTVVACFEKLSGSVRYVVEDDRGVLHIYSRKNLAVREPGGKP